MLDDLVRSVVCATTNDPGLLAGLVLLDRDGVLADILEPHELESAVALAVDTFGLKRVSWYHPCHYHSSIWTYLVLANDHVAQCSTLLEQEDGIGSATLRLARAGTTAAVVPVPLTVEGLAGSDLDDLTVGLGANSRRDTSSVSIACKSSRKESRSGSDDSGELHGEAVLMFQEGGDEAEGETEVD